MSKLDDILDDFGKASVLEGAGVYTDAGRITEYHPTNAEAKQQIKSLMLELIGEDENSVMSDQEGMHSGVRDQFRAELRQKVEEL